MNLTVNDLERGMTVTTAIIPVETENEVFIRAIHIMTNEVKAERGRDVSPPIWRIIVIVIVTATLRKDDLRIETVLMVDHRIETEIKNHFMKKTVESEKFPVLTCQVAPTDPEKVLSSLERGIIPRMEGLNRQLIFNIFRLLFDLERTEYVLIAGLQNALYF